MTKKKQQVPDQGHGPPLGVVMYPYNQTPHAPPAPQASPQISIPDVVYQGEVCDMYYDDKEDCNGEHQITAVFSVDPPTPVSKYDPACDQFQELEENNPNHEHSLDGGGSGDPVKGWTRDFGSTNLIDCCLTLAAAKDKVTALAERYRAHMVAAGISCGPVVVTVT